MRQNALPVSAHLAIAGLVLESGPFPTSIERDLGSGFYIALRERFPIHASSIPSFNG